MQCECQVHSSPARTERLPHQGFTRANYYSDTGENRSRLQLLWAQLVREFTQRRLTQERDRLPALSGLAAFAKMDTVDDYICGHWKSEFPESLLWSLEPSAGRRPHGEESKRLQPYYAPTWSWASVTGVVWYSFAEGNERISERSRTAPACEILETSITLASSNPFGLVTSGFIKIHGHVGPLPRRWKPPNQSSNLWALSCDSFSSGAKRTWDGEMWADVNTPSFEFDESDELVLTIIAFAASDGLRMFEGLALKKAGDDEPTFKRVGSVILIDGNNDSRLWLLQNSKKTVTII